MVVPTTFLLDLRDVVREFVSELPQPDQIWFFGSRAQRTGSKRSDVDILIVDRDAKLTVGALLEWLIQGGEERAPLDLFISRDGKIAESAVNSSLLRNDTDLTGMVGGLLLWDRTTGLVGSDSIPWVQEFRRGITFEMTTIPTDFSATLSQLPNELARMGLPNTQLGTDWGTIAQRCGEILAAAADATTRLLTRAPILNSKSAYPTNEYDAQNLFFLALRPWLPDLELNPFQIRYAGQDKFADLAAARSQLVIEVKFVSDAGSAAAVTKQLLSLSELYAQPSQVKAVIFAIVIAHDMPWDNVKIDHDHTELGRVPSILTRSIRLPKAP
jgi:REase_DpnII-MboI/Nucleotidyltransferase domain